MRNPIPAGGGAIRIERDGSCGAYLVQRRDTDRLGASVRGQKGALIPLLPKFDERSESASYVNFIDCAAFAA